MKKNLILTGFFCLSPLLAYGGVIETLGPKEVSSISLLKITPQMRGQLFLELTKKEKNNLSEVAVRFDVKNLPSEQDPVLRISPRFTNQELKNYFIKNPKKLNKLKLDTLVRLESSRELIQEESLVEQYSLNLTARERAKFIQQLDTVFEEASHKKFHSSKNNSAENILKALDSVLQQTRPSLDYGTIFDSNEDSPIQRLSHLKHLPLKILNQIEAREILAPNDEYRFKSLKTQLCSTSRELENLNCPNSNIKDLQSNDTERTLLTVKEEISALNQKLSQIVRSYNESDAKYIHKGVDKELDKIAIKYLALDNVLIGLYDNGLKEAAAELRQKLIQEFLNPIKNNYQFIRFFEEGQINHNYQSGFIKDIIENAKVLIKRDGERVISKEELKSLRKKLDTTLEKIGNRLGDTAVNILGQIFKKRKWVPKLNIKANFRGNYLTKYRQRTMDALFSPNGMKPGDIILEKDLMANNDVIIPGYFLHASIYLGTMSDFKEMDLWNDARFNEIRKQIEAYKNDPKKIKYLRSKLNVKQSFDEIAWFIESDRPGVGVHPIQKFLQTDGMVVLRPTDQDWGTKKIKDIIKRANDRVMFPYDYVHNVRNKFSVTCSKFVLQVFNFITFPVSKNLGYITHSPDQTGQPVSLDVNRPEDGELKLMMYFDPVHKGQLIFDRADRKTHPQYRTYLKNLGLLK